MKTIAVTHLRQHVAEVIAQLGQSDEPTIVLRRSRAAAYLVGPERYERDQEELARLRRQIGSMAGETSAPYGAHPPRREDAAEAATAAGRPEPDGRAAGPAPRGTAAVEGLRRHGGQVRMTTDEILALTRGEG